MFILFEIGLGQKGDKGEKGESDSSTQNEIEALQGLRNNEKTGLSPNWRIARLLFKNNFYCKCYTLRKKFEIHAFFLKSDLENSAIIF